MYMKLYAKNEEELIYPDTNDKNIQPGYRDGIWDRKMCQILLLNQERIRTLGKLQILGNIGSGHHQTSGDESKITKEYFRWMRKLLKTKLSGKNLKGIKTWTLPLVRYSGPFLNWTREELTEMDTRTRKLMTMHKALPLGDDIDRLYESRKEEGRWLASTEDCVEASIWVLEDLIKNNKKMDRLSWPITSLTI